MTRLTEDSAASHQTAAALWGMPEVWEHSDTVHISRSAPLRSPRRHGVRGHQTDLLDDEVVCVNGLYLTTQERTWLDLAASLSIEDLVIIADHLIRIPRVWHEDRWDPYTTVPLLEARLKLHKAQSGIRKARTALGLSRVGSDSPQETRLRLALDRAGLPEPELNVPLISATNEILHSPDLSYPEFRIAIEYEGDHHRSAEQLARDIRREEAVARAGWFQIRISKSDMGKGRAKAVQKIRRGLLDQGWSS